MALLVDEDSGDLIRNLWPTEFKCVADDPVDVTECAFWQAVPYNDVELSEWLQIVPNPTSCDRSRPYTVTHVPDAEDGNEDGAELYELAVRFTGFLERFNLGTLGNWDGKEQGAMKAVQSIVLSSGGYTEPWKATLQALNRLMSVVLKMVRPDQEFEPQFKVDAGGDVFMQRRVFVKANSNSALNVPPDVAHRGPELHGVGKTWHLDDRMEFGQLTRDGRVKHATNVVFRPGHFVEVTAYIELVINRDGRVRVQLRPSRVLLVSTQGQVKGRATKANAVKILKHRGNTQVRSALPESSADSNKAESETGMAVAGFEGLRVYDDKAMEE